MDKPKTICRECKHHRWLQVSGYRLSADYCAHKGIQTQFNPVTGESYALELPFCKDINMGVCAGFEQKVRTDSVEKPLKILTKRVWWRRILDL